MVDYTGWEGKKFDAFLNGWLRLASTALSQHSASAAVLADAHFGALSGGH